MKLKAYSTDQRFPTALDLFLTEREITMPKVTPIPVEQHRMLSAIAADIRRNWANVNFGAKPYLEAMSSLSSMQDRYFMDSADTIVRYFLSNANTWRGPEAKRIKDELRGMLPLDKSIHKGIS
jgi:hypothetical protein